MLQYNINVISTGDAVSYGLAYFISELPEGEYTGMECPSLGDEAITGMQTVC
jgi:hypothetical protein